MDDLFSIDGILALFKRKKSKLTGVVGLTLFSDGFALVQLDYAANGEVLLKMAHSVECGGDNCTATLAALVKEHGLTGMPCAVVLPRGSYNLIQINRPDIPEEELRDAVRWQIKDLLDFPAEEAVIDLFSNGDSGSQEVTFAVAARESDVLAAVEGMRTAGLEIKAIDIPELALRNILAKNVENERGVALLILWEDNGLITVVRNGELSMSRRLNFGVGELLAAADNESIEGVEISQAQQAILDDVVLEIQRSLDYYESSISRQAVSTLMLAPAIQPIPGLNDYLNTYLAPDVRELDLAGWLGGESLSGIERSRCLAAVGVALRSDLLK